MRVRAASVAAVNPFAFAGWADFRPGDRRSRANFCNKERRGVGRGLRGARINRGRIGRRRAVRGTDAGDGEGPESGVPGRRRRQRPSSDRPHPALRATFSRKSGRRVLRGRAGDDFLFYRIFIDASRSSRHSEALDRRPPGPGRRKEEPWLANLWSDARRHRAFDSSGSARDSGSKRRPACCKPLKYNQIPWSPRK